MIMFWLASAVLVLMLVLSVAVPVYRSRVSTANADRDALNKAIYQDRLEELEVESEGGLVADQKALITELQKTLLDDIPQGSQAKNDRARAQFWLWGSCLIAIACSYALYSKVGGMNAVIEWQETAQRLPELSQRLMDEQSSPLSDEELADLSLALRTRLQQTPDDAMGWLLLGRLGMASRDVDMATGAMRKAWFLSPEMFETRFGYAQSLLLSGDGLDGQKGRKLLSGLLQEEPDNLQVLSLLAFDAFEAQEYQAAIAMWTRMRLLLDDNDPRAVMLDRSIARAQMSITGDPVLMTVKIELDEQVSIPTQGVLIVSAHTADGAPMPVAAKRLPLSAFPVTVMLRNSDSMIEGRNLVDLDEMVIRTRIDTDGNVGTRDGDLFGESLTVSQGGEVEVKIMNQFGS